MLTNRRKTKADKDCLDKIFEAVCERMAEKNKGFFIISCGPWIHPANAVPNCYAIMFDGFIQYKFELKYGGLQMAEIRSTEYLRLPFYVGQFITIQELLEAIKTA